MPALPGNLLNSCNHHLPPYRTANVPKRKRCKILTIVYNNFLCSIIISYEIFGRLKKNELYLCLT